MENGDHIITTTLSKGHRKERPISIGSTASRMRKPSKDISTRVPVLFRCGWEGILTRILMIHMEENPI
jgi:hypothetical protein